MRKNIRKKDHPIQFAIARLRRRCAENADGLKFIGKLFVLLSVYASLIYASAKLPKIIEKIEEKQAEQREKSKYFFENMQQNER